MSLILLMLACGDAEVEFQDLTQDEAPAATDEGANGEAGTVTNDDGSTTETVVVENDDGSKTTTVTTTQEDGTTQVVVTETGTDGSETVVIGGENGVQATAGGGTGAHATIGGEKGVDVGAGGEEGGAQIDIAEGAFKANAGGGEEFKVQIGKNNEVGIQGKSLKVGDKKVSWGDKKKE